MPCDSLVWFYETEILIIAAAIGTNKRKGKSVDFSDVYYHGIQSIESSRNTFV